MALSVADYLQPSGAQGYTALHAAFALRRKALAKFGRWLRRFRVQQLRLMFTQCEMDSMTGLLGSRPTTFWPADEHTVGLAYAYRIDQHSKQSLRPLGRPLRSAKSHLVVDNVSGGTFGMVERYGIIVTTLRRNDALVLTLHDCSQPVRGVYFESSTELLGLSNAAFLIFMHKVVEFGQRSAALMLHRREIADELLPESIAILTMALFILCAQANSVN